MHELSIAQGIVDLVRQHVPGERARDVRTVRVRLGALSGVVADSLAFCFDAVVDGTPLAAAQLDIEGVPTEAACDDCGRRFAPADLVFRCPACGSGRVRLLAGQELQVVHVELDEASETAPARSGVSRS